MPSSAATRFAEFQKLAYGLHFDGNADYYLQGPRSRVSAASLPRLCRVSAASLPRLCPASLTWSSSLTFVLCRTQEARLTTRKE